MPKVVVGSGVSPEAAGVGECTDGYCGAEARCPRCAGTSRYARTDGFGGVALWCSDCHHVERVGRRAAVDVATQDGLPKTHRGAAMARAAQGAATRAALLRAVPREWTRASTLAVPWRCTASVTGQRVRDLAQHGLVETRRITVSTPRGGRTVVEVRAR